MNEGPQVDWEDQDWEFVLNKVRSGECVPFLGAGASASVFPTGGALAKKLATKYSYPFPDTSDLTKVSQYIAVRSDRKNAKLEVLNILNEVSLPPEPQGPYKGLARLPLPLYVTTNYDRLMYDALRLQPPRVPREAVCRWNSFITSAPSEINEPTIATPLVFYLHGIKEDANSLVLTEDDYLDFLSEMIRRDDLLPDAVETAIRKSTLLFLGYRLADWNFRILFRQLANYNVTSIAVLLPPSPDDPSKDKVKSYFDKHFGALNVTICWATAEAFVATLIERYANKFGKGALVGRS